MSNKRTLVNYFKMGAKRALLIGVVIDIFLFIRPCPASAWGSTWMGANLEMAVNTAHRRVGPIRYTAALALENAGYASDIYYGSTENPVPDYIFTAGTSLHFFLPLKKRVIFHISEVPQYIFFLHTEKERGLNNVFTGSVHVALDRVYLQAGGVLSNTKERLNTELNVNVRRKENQLNGLALWQVSQGTSFAVQYRRLTFDYENFTSGVSNIRDTLNRTENYVNITAYLQQHTRARFYLDGEYGSYIFTKQLSSYKDSRSYSIYGGIEFIPPVGGYEGQTAGIRGRLNLGYKRFDFLDPQQKDFAGLAGETGISIGFIKLTAIQFFFSKGPQFSVYSGQSSYVQTSYGAGLSRSLSRQVLFTYNFLYGNNDYLSTDGTNGGPSGKGVEKYLTHSFRMNLRLRKNFEVSLLANLSKRNSRVAPRPVSERNFFGFSLTYGTSPGGLSVPGGSFS